MRVGHLADFPLITFSNTKRSVREISADQNRRKLFRIARQDDVTWLQVPVAANIFPATKAGVVHAEANVRYDMYQHIIIEFCPGKPEKELLHSLRIIVTD